MQAHETPPAPPAEVPPADRVRPVPPADLIRPVPPRVAWAPVGLVTAGAAALLLATLNGYDYHRDELYFRMLGQHPAWGYVDQPPLTPLLGRVSTAIFGDTLWALRLPSVLCMIAAALLVALLARELGGGRVAQPLAALAVVSSFGLIGGHTLLTITPDLLVWSAVLLFAVRALRRDEPRWWLGVGVVTGVGLYNKHLVILLLLCLGAALLLVGPRRVLRSGWLWAGAGIALVLGAPNLVYQATHDWPQLTMAHALAEHKGDEARLTFVPLQLILLGPPLVPIWIAGLVSLLRNPTLRPVRALGVAYLVMCVLLLAIAGQPYYTTGLLYALYAAGCVATERWLARATVGVRRRILVGAAVGLNVAVSAVIALPLLPVAVLAKTPVPDINQVTRDQIGWPAYVRQVADVYHALSADEQVRAVIITGNYGEAGAIARYGPAQGLPAVYSGQNELWFLARPPESATVVIVLGVGRDRFFAERFGACAVVAKLDNGVGIDNEEQGVGVRVCRDPRRPWRELWPDFQHYD